MDVSEIAVPSSSSSFSYLSNYCERVRNIEKDLNFSCNSHPFYIMFDIIIE